MKQLLKEIRHNPLLWLLAFVPVVQEECYGNERLLTEAAALSGQSASDITPVCSETSGRFAGTAAQSDDIAILAFKVASDGAKGTGSD